MRISVLAKLAGVNPKTIRYYEDIGLMLEPPRTEAGYRQYDDGDMERLAFIHSAKSLGLSLTEIKEVLQFRDRGTYPCPYVLQLIDHKLQEIESRIEGLRLLAGDLRRMRKVASRIPPEELQAKARYCHIIENRAMLQSSR